MAVTSKIKEWRKQVPTRDRDHSLTVELLDKYFRKAKVDPFLTVAQATQIVSAWRADNNWGIINARRMAYLSRVDEGIRASLNDGSLNPEWLAAIKPWLRSHITIMKRTRTHQAMGLTIFFKKTIKGTHNIQPLFHATCDNQNNWTMVPPLNPGHHTTRNVEFTDPGIVPGSIDDGIPPALPDTESEDLDRAIDDLNYLPDNDDDSGDSDAGGGSGISPVHPSSRGVLPPNLFTGFGGIDASVAIGLPEMYKNDMFDLGITDPSKTTVYQCQGPDERPNLYSVPNYLRFTWSTNADDFAVVGSSKMDFTHTLSKTMNIGGNLLGFGGEMKRTFGSMETKESFRKYMAHYARRLIYEVEIKDVDKIKDHLTADFKQALATWPADKIVEHYGTHYTTQCSFGGLYINSSTLDTLDTLDKHDMTTAIELTVPFKKPGTGEKIGNATGGVKDENKTTQSIKESMQVNNAKTVGGTPPDSEKSLGSWTRSLASNPSAVKFKLKPMDTLVDDVAKQQAIQKAIKDRLAATAPEDGCSLIAIRVPLKPRCSDKHSGGKHDITVAYPAAPDGWFYVGQFAQPVEEGDAYGQESFAVAIRGNPNFDIDPSCPCPPLLPANTLELRWSSWKWFRELSRMYGFYTPTLKISDSAAEQLIEKFPILKKSPLLEDTTDPAPSLTVESQYISLGDIFELTLNTGAFNDPEIIKRLPLFHVGCLKKLDNIPPKVWLWDDTDTGGNPDVTVMGAPNVGAVSGLSGLIPGANDAKWPRQMVVGAANQPSPPWFLFKCLNRGNIGENWPWYTLDWDKVKWLENKWMANSPF